MSGPFDYGSSGKGSMGDKSDGAGVKHDLPLHIEKKDKGTEKPKMKNSNGGNLPWGGQPAEQKKAYMSGAPKSKGSMKSKLGPKGGSGTGIVTGGKALQGHSRTITNKKQKGC